MKMGGIMVETHGRASLPTYRVRLYSGLPKGANLSNPECNLG